MGIVDRQNKMRQEELAELKTRLDEAENMLRVIRSGDADAIIVNTSDGERMFVLKGAEQPYREMVETMSEGAVTVTPGGVILYCNQRFAEMVMANLETIIGSNLLAYCSDENFTEISIAFQQSQSSVPRIMATLLTSDATLVPVNMAMRSQCDHGSDNIAIVIADLTKWQHVEQAREGAIRALRMKNACSSAIIHSIDEAAMLTEVCQVMVAIGGYKSAWISNTRSGPPDSLCPGAQSSRTCRYNDNLDVFSVQTELCRGSIETVSRGCGARVALLPLRANCEFFGCWVICSDEPDPFNQKELELLAALADDLVFGLAAQRNRGTRARLAAIVEWASDAIVGCDLDGTITSWNIAAERLLAYRADDLIGQPLRILCPPEAADETDRLFEKVQRGETVEEYDAVRLAQNGRRISVSLTFSPIRNDAGCFAGAAIFMRDATVRKAAEEALRLTQTLAIARDQAVEASQAKSRFLATVTHELRTPLHGILGYAELLTLEGGLNATQLGRVETMMAAGRGLLETINAVLDMSQIESNRLELSPVEIELPDLLGECLDVVRPAAEAKGLALAPAPAAPLRVFADRGRLRQVLINLLGNAIKFTPAGSVEVRLQRKKTGDYVRLEVADTGPGVWRRHRDKLFEAFERLNAEAVSGIEGSGLGLAIAARIMHSMGGRIGYDDNPGGGSVFWVELPAGAVPLREVEVVAQQPLAGRKGLRVLVVDDDVFNRNIASGFLTPAGHDVVCVDNGAAAVDAAATWDFDVVLMDVRMPGMNGLEATRLIRALPAPRCKVRVIAVTAQAFTEQVEACRKAGMDSHVSKPFKRSTLLAALENATVGSNDTGHAAMPPPAAPAAAQPELPILDDGQFGHIAEALSAATLVQHLQTLVMRCEGALCELRGPGRLSQTTELAEIAHKLAGEMGLLGFLHIASTAKQFERAVMLGTVDVPVLGDRLSAAIEASLATMRECIERFGTA